ncbi:hypothetical protein BDV19DRAFT_383658 [Aspergillus venezuelensis]
MQPEEPPASVNNHQQIVAKIKARAAADEQAAASQVVQAGELHDANPWLQMTQWARYLAKDQVHYQDLLDVVAMPDPKLEDPTSHVTRVIWDTMEQLAWRSQHTIKHCGNGIRMAAVSTSPNQMPYQPLRAYMDEKSIQDHVWPWQQILLFIIRTQINWPWRQGKPGYPFIMTLIKTACLEFCIKLLNQKIKVHKYESPLVCTMAVLGQGEKAWQDPKSYPPIISRALWLDPQYMDIIHMWAAAAEQGAWTRDATNNNLGLIMEDKGFTKGVKTILLSPPSSLLSSSHAILIGRVPWSPRMPFQAGVDWMVQRFMVRGQHGPVEVLLDWRTFGLKIYYNTTTLDHVTWIGQEQLLYKKINFTMGKFHRIIHGMVAAAWENPWLEFFAGSADPIARGGSPLAGP